MKPAPLRVLITAGPTREFFDPVRFLSNPSSGKMGYALTKKAKFLGYEVTLVTGPVSLPPPAGVKVIPVVSALDMLREVKKLFSKMDILIMTAAVSDYRPATYAKQKVKKTGKGMTIRFVPNPDILKTMGAIKKGNQVLIGFAAETTSLKKNALKKLNEKNLDAIIMNDVSRRDIGFESGQNQVTFFTRDGGVIVSKKDSKEKIADFIWKQILAL